MIPSDHFVRFYNEVFKALQERGHKHLQAYWREIGRQQSKELVARFREGGLAECYAYWSNIAHEENCEADLTLTDDYFEFRMHRCPSLSKAMDNDASTCDRYCDHCMAWVQPVAEDAGLHVAYDMESRTEPHCVCRIYTDSEKAETFQRNATLPAEPYADTGHRPT